MIALTGAVIWELRHRDPVVDLRLRQERNFCLSNITMFLVGFVIYASIVLYPFYLQNLMGCTAEKSGQVLTPSGAVIFIILPLVGWLLTRRTQFHQHVPAGHLTATEGEMVRQQAAMPAFVEAFWVLSLVTALLIPLLFLMKKSAPQKGLVVGH